MVFFFLCDTSLLNCILGLTLWIFCRELLGKLWLSGAYFMSLQSTPAALTFVLVTVHHCERFISECLANVGLPSISLHATSILMTGVCIGLDLPLFQALLSACHPFEDSGLRPWSRGLGWPGISVPLSFTVASLMTESPLIFWSRSLSLKRVLSQGDSEKSPSFASLNQWDPMGITLFLVSSVHLTSYQVSLLGSFEVLECQAWASQNLSSVRPRFLSILVQSVSIPTSDAYEKDVEWCGNDDESCE